MFYLFNCSLSICFTRIAMNEWIKRSYSCLNLSLIHVCKPISPACLLALRTKIVISIPGIRSHKVPSTPFTPAIFSVIACHRVTMATGSIAADMQREQTAAAAAQWTQAVISTDAWRRAQTNVHYQRRHHFSLRNSGNARNCSTQRSELTRLRNTQL